MSVEKLVRNLLSDANKYYRFKGGVAGYRGSSGWD